MARPLGATLEVYDFVSSPSLTLRSSQARRWVSPSPAVSNVSIVSIAALIGVSQLGQLFTDGFNRNAMGPILVGILACVALAVALDAAIALLARVLTPWLSRRTPA